MKKWKLKQMVQKTISYLPYSRSINYLFQKYVTKGVYLNDEYFYDRLTHAKEHLHYFKQFSTKKLPQSALELGTGWYPVVPVAFYLVGVEVVYSVDISFLTSKERIKTTLEKFVEAYTKGTLGEYLTVMSERWKTLENILKDYNTLSLEEILKKLNIIYLIEDARQLSLAEGSIDLVNSNNTFEHIYPEILIPILADFKRVTNKHHGVMSHFIDMSDHFAHFDKTITVYNFLQFSEEKWKRLDNSLQPQSRLRISEYKTIYEQLGLPIHAETSRKGDITALNTVELDSKYKTMPAETVAITHCHFVTQFKG